jgi:signal transduction histidine kinase
MSHELRTPLNAVIGFTDLLESGATGPLEPRQLDYLRDIQASARHLLALINDILDLAKIEAGQMQLSDEIVSVGSVLERVAALAERQAAPRRITIDVRVADGAEFVRGDHHRLEQVLVNLVSNAVKFTPDGGRVDIEARGAGADLMVSVRDTGIGILPEQRQKIFEAFSQGKQLSEGVPEGTGLGLSLVKGLVELHGGRVVVESQPEHGSNFVVTLPGRAVADVPSMRGAT